MSRAIFIENVAKKGKLSKAEAKRTVDLVLGEIEAGLKKSKKEGRYTIGNFGTFTVVKRPRRQGPQPADRRGDPHPGLQGPQVPPRRPTPQGCRGEVVPASRVVRGGGGYRGTPASKTDDLATSPFGVVTPGAPLIG